MAIAANKRSIMVLYSASHDLYSHRVRIVLAEKGVPAEMVEVRAGEHHPELLELNASGQLPTLVDRDLVLSDSNIIMEYLDERFPHPPLLPVYPVARAKSRLMITRIQNDWYAAVHKIESGNEAQAKAGRKQLEQNIVGIIPLFAGTGLPFFLGEEFSLIDCSLAPLFWRLPRLGVEIPAQAKVVKAYAERLFNRPSFQSSLMETEIEVDS